MVTDHKPLVNLYNNPRKQGPARVEHHRLKLQGYRFEVRYEKGETNPSDYNSRHPLPLTREQQDNATEDAFFVNAIIDKDIPDALTEKMVQDATNQDDRLARLKDCILRKGYIPESATDIVSFRSVFSELSVAKQLVLRGNRIVLPESLQPDVITLALSLIHI